MNEPIQNLWAPWRMEYIRGMTGPSEPGGCFLCRYWNDPGADEQNLVVSRQGTTMAIMNRFPYTAGHLLIADAAHCGRIQDLPKTAVEGIFRMTQRMAESLEKAISAQGMNIGINQGLCSGAGVPDHLHVHIVPRWSGDTNYMSVLANVRVVNDSLEAVYRKLCEYEQRRHPEEAGS